MSTGIRIMYTEGVDAVVSLRDETKEGTSMLKRVAALATVWQLISQNWMGFPGEESPYDCSAPRSAAFSNASRDASSSLIDGVNDGFDRCCCSAPSEGAGAPITSSTILLRSIS